MTNTMTNTMTKIITVLALVAMTTLQPIMAEEPSGFPYNGQLDVNQYCTGILNNVPGTQHQFSGTAQLLQIACHNQHTYINNMLTSIVSDYKNSLDGMKNTMDTTKNRLTEINRKLQESDTARFETNIDYDNRLLKLNNDFTVKLMELQTELNAIKAMKQECVKENQISSIGGVWSYFSTIVVVVLFAAMMYYYQNFLRKIFEYVRDSFADAEKAKNERIATQARLTLQIQHNKDLDKVADELEKAKEALVVAEQKIAAEEEKASNARKQFQALEATHSREQLAIAEKKEEFNKAVIIMNEKVATAEHNAMVAKSEFEEYKKMLNAAQSTEQVQQYSAKALEARKAQAQQEQTVVAAKQEIETIQKNLVSLEVKKSPEQTEEINAAAEAAKNLEDSVTEARAEKERFAEEAHKKTAELQKLQEEAEKLERFKQDCAEQLATVEVSDTTTATERVFPKLDLFAAPDERFPLASLATVSGSGKESNLKDTTTPIPQIKYDTDMAERECIQKVNEWQSTMTDVSFDPEKLCFASTRAGSVSGDMEYQVAKWWKNQYRELTIVFDHPEFLSDGFFIDRDYTGMNKKFAEQAEVLFERQCEANKLDPKKVGRGVKPTSS